MTTNALEQCRLAAVGGLVGKEYKANWKQNGECLVLKSFNLDNVKEINYEIILKLLDEEYLLVKEYAEGGTLRNYLETKFLSLNWENKYGLALQFRRIRDAGQIEENKHIEMQKESDIYGIWMLFWELSSGKKSFADIKYDLSLAERIAKGLREEILVKGTPEGYSDLYKTELWIILNGHEIESSKRAFNSNNNRIKFNEALEPSDIFINFPVADIIEKILKFPFPLLYLLVKEACAIMGQIEKGKVHHVYPSLLLQDR
ncbi:hypothetical protein RhiirB3_525733 [Rhizophagus irregularis]|nr:hypothetical protein RhiirB3_525733 [Rhizophagus irregularis]